MRRRRKILLYSENSHKGSCLAFTLNLQPQFAVQQIDSRIGYLALLDPDWHAIAILADKDDEKTADLIKRAYRFRIPVMVINPTNDLNTNLQAHATLTNKATSYEIINYLLSISARKRGPRSGSTRSAQVVAEDA